MLHAETTDGVCVAYAELGDARAGEHRVPLLMAHATGFHSLVWQPLARILATRFRCVAFDERGHGDTPPPPDGNYEWLGFARDALAVIDAERLEKPFGLGHSAGGAALLLAELERPGTFQAIYCYEPIAPPPFDIAPAPDVMPSQRDPLSASARRRREVFDSRDAAYENYAGKPPLAVLDPAALRAYVDHGFEDLPDGTVRLKCRGEQEARTYEMAGTHRVFERLGDVGCPVTIAYGELTQSFGPAVYKLIAERLRHGAVEELPGLGHFGPMQDPDAVAASMLRALAAS